MFRAAANPGFAAHLSEEMVVKRPEESAQPIAETTGADLLVKALIDEEVEVVFGYPGGAIMPVYDALHGMKKGLKDMVAPQGMFEDLGLKYIGPVDGHDIGELEHAFRSAIERGDTGPIVVHVLTQKGRGYSFAEDDDEKHLHDAPVFDPVNGPPKAVPTGYTQAFADSLIKEAQSDQRIVAI